MIGLLIAYCENCKVWHVFAEQKHLFSVDSQAEAFENINTLVVMCQVSYEAAKELSTKYEINSETFDWLYTLVCPTSQEMLS